MELNISGRSEGLAASSAINDFFIREGTATHLLNANISTLKDLSLPFESLGIFVEALNHTLPSSIPILIASQKKLIRTQSGKFQKMYDFTISNAYYQLGRVPRNRAVASALLRIADQIKTEFCSNGGEALASEFQAVANSILAPAA